MRPEVEKQFKEAKLHRCSVDIELIALEKALYPSGVDGSDWLHRKRDEIERSIQCILPVRLVSSEERLEDYGRYRILTTKFMSREQS